jgi:hypothetical protein
MEHVQTQ